MHNVETGLLVLASGCLALIMVIFMLLAYKYKGEKLMYTVAFIYVILMGILEYLVLGSPEFLV